MRGMMTEGIANVSKEMLGYPITQVELRLMPYIVNVMMNDRRLDPAKISQEERGALTQWRSQGFIEGGASGLKVSGQFWNACCSIVGVAYANYDGEGFLEDN